MGHFGNLLNGNAETEDSGALCSPARFRRMLERERALADRSGQVFSLVTFTVNGLSRHPRRLRKLAAILAEQVRLSDEIGWFQKGQLGLILPQTGPDGAAVLAERVLSDTAAFDWSAEYAIYCYPSLPGSNGLGGPSPPPRQGGPPNRQCDAGSTFSMREDLHNGKSGGLEPFLAPPVPRWKRVLDVAGALTGLILASPLFGLIALLIKASSPGPILFRQQRIGYMKRRFTLLKFRTMHVGSDEDLHRRHLHRLIDRGVKMTKLDASKDPRVIPGGKLLRFTGLDELPQLVNVLRGEMSLVGPRPCLPYEAEKYELWQIRRFDTLPGLTGKWQVSGKNGTTFRQMIRLDISYLKKRTPWTDLLIAFKTLPAIINQRSEKNTRRKGLGRHTVGATASGDNGTDCS